MPKSINKSLALFLSLSISLLGVSPEWFHDHQEEAACHEQHHVGEVDACHLALHHSDGIHTCEDHDHLLEQEVDCALCNLALAHYWLISAPDKEEACTLLSFDKSEFTGVQFVTVDQFDQLSLRGPPIAV
ncbi:MAG: hypothetical protein R2813_03855 [Flavobacteriales bacterium]